MAWFRAMVDNSLEYARREKAAGNRIVGIMCEYTPRELIMAAGGVPVCLCGGDASTIPAAEEELPSNLCPLIKSTYGHHVLKSNPFLAMMELLVAETTCDGKKKMFELMAEAMPVHLLELPQKENDADALAHWLAEMGKLKSSLEARFKLRITNDRLRGAIRTMNRERAARRGLAALLEKEAPPITGRQLLELRSIISGNPEEISRYEEALRQFEDKGADPANGARVRVLMTGVPMVRGAERVLDIVEDHGGLVVCQENCTGLKPIMEDIDPDSSEPLVALAVKYFHLPCSVMTRNSRRIDLLKDLVRRFRPQCIIELVWQTCITYDVESFHIRRLAEKELNLPYLRIETDYSPSDSARIAVRVEALYETVRNRPPAR